MKGHCVIFVSAVSAFTVFAVEPHVSGLRLISQTSAGVCTFGYTLSDAPAVVTFDIVTNGAAASPQTDFRGTVNELIQPGAVERTFTWRPSGDLSVSTLPTASFRLTAWPTNALPDYIVIDIGAKTEPNRYYPSASHLPHGGLRNRIYATDLLVMRKIPAAGVTWYMGSDSTTDSPRNNNETRHRVTLTSDYWFSVYPVTLRQYLHMGGVNGSPLNMRIKKDNDDHPATGFAQGEGATGNTLRGSPSDNINWPTTGTNVLYTSVIGRFRTATGITFDLPTEAQWEYACRAGTGTATYDGHMTMTTNVANRLAAWHGNSITEYMSGSSLQQATLPVGSFEPNAWGIYDLYGNVWESCLDWYQASLTDATDPKGPEKSAPTSGDKRVRKGGCFSTTISQNALRSAYRSDGGSGTDFGIRLVCPIGLK